MRKPSATCTAHLMVALCAVLVISSSSAEGWTLISSIPERVDGFFFSGTEYVAYKLSPHLTLYDSSNGVNWLFHEYPVEPCALGHDNHGTLYALSRTVAGSVYSANLLKLTTDGTWTNLATLASYFDILPVGASIAATENLLLIKLYTIFGEGWWSGTPPNPVFVSDRVNPSDFVEAPDGEQLSSILADDEHFIATRSDEVIVGSTNGVDWVPLFRPKYPALYSQVLGLWHNLYVVYGHFTQLSVQDEITTPISVRAPAYFHFALNPIRDLRYDGSHLIIVDSQACYVSVDYAASWATFPLGSYCGMAHNDTTYLLTDRTASNTLIYCMTSQPLAVSTTVGGSDILQVSRSSIAEVFGPVTNVLLAAAVTAPACSNKYIQFEYSLDLVNWRLYGLPSTNSSILSPISTDQPSHILFRTRQWDEP